MSTATHYTPFASLPSLPRHTHKSLSISHLNFLLPQQPKPSLIFGDYKTSEEDMIGMGSCSRVYRGFHSKTNESVALKVIQVEKISSKVEKRFLKNEINCLKELKYSNCIIQLKQVIYTKKYIVIVTELCRDSLLKIMKKHYKSKQALHHDLAIKTFGEIVEGYLSMRQFGFIHRDIKPANILIDSNGCAKLADLGFATTDAKICEDKLVKAGSPLYMAPQVLKGNMYSAKGDIWAMGIVLLEMLIGDLPWNNAKQSQLHRILLKTDFEDLIPQSVQDKWRNILLRCLEKNVGERWDIMELMRSINPDYSFKVIHKVNKNDDSISTLKRVDKKQVERIATTDSSLPTTQARSRSLTLKQRILRSKSKQGVEQSSERKPTFKFKAADKLQTDKLIEIKLNYQEMRRFNKIKQEQSGKLNLARLAFRIVEGMEKSRDNIHCSCLALTQVFSMSLASFIVSTLNEIKQIKSEYSQQQIQTFKGNKEYLSLRQIVHKYETNYKQYFRLKFNNNFNLAYQIDGLLDELKKQLSTAHEHVDLIYSQMKQSGLQQISDEEICMFMELVQNLASFHKYLKMYRWNFQLFLKLNRIVDVLRKHDGVVKVQDIKRICELLEK